MSLPHGQRTFTYHSDVVLSASSLRLATNHDGDDRYVAYACSCIHTGMYLRQTAQTQRFESPMGLFQSQPTPCVYFAHLHVKRLGPFFQEIDRDRSFWSITSSGDYVSRGHNARYIAWPRQNGGEVRESYMLMRRLARRLSGQAKRFVTRPALPRHWAPSGTYRPHGVRITVMSGVDHPAV